MNKDVFGALPSELPATKFEFKIQNSKFKIQNEIVFNFELIILNWSEAT